MVCAGCRPSQATGLSPPNDKHNACLSRHASISLDMAPGTKVNHLSDSILSPYTITLGDECQAVLSGPKGLFHDIITIRMGIYPHRMRFSVGMGAVATRINRTAAIGMDGEAFYNARDGLEALKKIGGTFAVSGLRLPHAGLIAESLKLVSWLSADWERNRLGVLLGLI
jgi:hypothetical protein